MTEKETTFVNYWKSIVYLNRDAMQLQPEINSDLEQALKFVYLLEGNSSKDTLDGYADGWRAFISFYVESVKFGYGGLLFEKSLESVSTLRALKDRLELEKSKIKRTIKFRKLIVAAWEAQERGETEALITAIGTMDNDSFVNIPNGLERYSADTVIGNALEKILTGRDNLAFITSFFIRMSKWSTAVQTPADRDSLMSTRYSDRMEWFSASLDDSPQKYKELLNWLVRKCIDKDTTDFLNDGVETRKPLEGMSVLLQIDSTTRRIDSSPSSTGAAATTIEYDTLGVRFEKVLQLLTLRIPNGLLSNSTQSMAYQWPTFGTDPIQSSSTEEKQSSGVAFLMAMGGAVNILTDLGEEGYSKSDKDRFKAMGDEEERVITLEIRLDRVVADLDAATAHMGTETISVSERYSKDDRYFKLAFRWWKYFKNQSIKPVSTNPFKFSLVVPRERETSPEYPNRPPLEHGWPIRDLWDSAGLERDPYTYTRLELLTDPPKYLPTSLLENLTLSPFEYKKYLDAKRQHTDTMVEFMKHSILNAEVKTLEGEKVREVVIKGVEEALRSRWITFAKTQANLLESMEDSVEEFIEHGTPLDLDPLDGELDPLFVDEFMKTEKDTPLYFTRMGVDLKFNI
jgi:hypothetical protein